MSKQQRIVVIGGGTGTYTVLSGLKKHPVKLSAVVSMADDGGSTRILREEFGVLPPGSVRPAMIALAEEEEMMAQLFNYRFKQGHLEGDNLGNLLITAASRMASGDFTKAIKELSEVLRVQGKVIPSTLKNCKLVARLEDGRIVKGERNIDEPKHNGSLRIEEVWLEPKRSANPKAMEAIMEADKIVIGPGDLHSSVIPNFLLKGMTKALKESNAKKIFVCNIMTKFGETHDYKVSDFVNEMEKYIGKDVLDHVIVNTKRPDANRVRRHEKARSRFVEYDKENMKGASYKVVTRSLLRKEGFIRHDSDKLAKVITQL